jgi:GT2 family glycosyltransferase
MGDPRVGVVVLTHNRAGEVARTVERLVALPARPRIVVVDNASSDGTAAALRRRFPGVAVVRLDKNLGAAGRNVGVQVCDRPYVALCDDDTWWAPGSLARAADLFDAHRSLGVLTGRVVVGESERLAPTCAAMANSPLGSPPGLPGPALLGFHAGAAMVRRAAFLEVGGFERRLFLGAEEQLLAIDLASAGWALAYVDDVVIHHYPSEERDTDARERLLVRNRLWIAWLRRPFWRALARLAATVRLSLRDRAARRALAEALAGLPWALRHRRVVPASVERGLRRLESAGLS